jgi:hypothetical protein
MRVIRNSEFLLDSDLFFRMKSRIRSLITGAIIDDMTIVPITVRVMARVEIISDIHHR